MFVFNIKVNFKKIVAVIIVISITIALLVNIFSSNNSLISTVNSSSKHDYVLTTENYVENLKLLHENIDSNIGKTISLTGFVYRNDDFDNDIFVCGRNMIIESLESVAGILCKSDDADILKDNQWVEIIGVLEKTDYNGNMPIIKVTSIKKIDPLENTYVE